MVRAVSDTRGANHFTGVQLHCHYAADKSLGETQGNPICESCIPVAEVSFRPLELRQLRLS